MTNEKLIKLAASVVFSKKMGDNTSGDVGCTSLTDKGKVYTGVCNVDVSIFGKTKKEALDNLNEALELYFEDVNRSLSLHFVSLGAHNTGYTVLR